MKSPDSWTRQPITAASRKVTRIPGQFGNDPVSCEGNGHVLVCERVAGGRALASPQFFDALGALKLDSQPPWLQPCESVDACFEGASRTFNSLKRACRKVPDCRSRSIADPSRTLGLGQFGEDLHLGFSQLDLERFLGWRVFRRSVVRSIHARTSGEDWGSWHRR
jgi:hypothetical protein